MILYVVLFTLVIMIFHFMEPIVELLSALFSFIRNNWYVVFIFLYFWRN